MCIYIYCNFLLKKEMRQNSQVKHTFFFYNIHNNLPEFCSTKDNEVFSVTAELGGVDVGALRQEAEQVLQEVVGGDGGQVPLQLRQDQQLHLLE